MAPLVLGVAICVAGALVWALAFTAPPRPQRRRRHRRDGWFYE